MSASSCDNNRNFRYRIESSPAERLRHLGDVYYAGTESEAKANFPKVDWWFWGHEHTLGIFPEYMTLKRGRCVGASAGPVFLDQQSYAPSPTQLQTLDGTMPTWDPQAVLGASNNMYNNCFAVMTLTGASATVEYYQVPLLKPAVRFPVTDACKEP
jgi:hypothetical protein